MEPSARIRTCDILLTGEALCQLSYDGISGGPRRYRTDQEWLAGPLCAPARSPGFGGRWVESNSQGLAARTVFKTGPVARQVDLPNAWRMVKGSNLRGDLSPAAA